MGVHAHLDDSSFLDQVAIMRGMGAKDSSIAECLGVSEEVIKAAKTIHSAKKRNGRAAKKTLKKKKAEEISALKAKIVDAISYHGLYHCDYWLENLSGDLLSEYTEAANGSEEQFRDLFAEVKRELIEGVAGTEEELLQSAYIAFRMLGVAIRFNGYEHGLDELLEQIGQDYVARAWLWHGVSSNAAAMERSFRQKLWKDWNRLVWNEGIGGLDEYHRKGLFEYLLAQDGATDYRMPLADPEVVQVVRLPKVGAGGNIWKAAVILLRLNKPVPLEGILCSAAMDEKFETTQLKKLEDYLSKWQAGASGQGPLYYMPLEGKKKFLHEEIEKALEAFNNANKREEGKRRSAERKKMAAAELPPERKRAINLEALKTYLRNLKIEWDRAELTAAQLVIVMQQGSMDKLPLAEGGDIFTKVQEGLLTPKVIREWVLSEEEEPTPSGGGVDVPLEPGHPKGAPVEPGSTGVEAEPPGAGGGAAPSGPEDPAGGDQPPAPVEPTKVEPVLPPLGVLDPEQQLHFLDSPVFASADDEAIAALSSIGLHQLWAQAYHGTDEEQEVVAACERHQSDRPWTTALQQQFLEEHRAARALSIPESYRFTVQGKPAQPKLMQRHVAAQAVKRRRLLVLSDMGTGKTLAAQIAVMTDGAKRILVVTPNSCVEQWRSTFSDSWAGIHAVVSHKAPALNSGGPTVWVLPCHRLSGMDDTAVHEAVMQFLPDAVVMDEVHMVKQRHVDQCSRRRDAIEKLITLASGQKPELMVLGMSGTAVINNLMEAKKLVELVFGEERPDLATEGTPSNAMRMHQALMANGIRQRSQGEWPVMKREVEVDATYLINEVAMALRYPKAKRMPMVERTVLLAKLDAVVRSIQGPTVIATQYVEGFIDPLRKAMTAAGYRVGVHTGQEKLPVHGHRDAIAAFKAGAVDVLLASIDTLGTGVDGLQHVSSRMVIPCLPWTAASLEQLIARLARSGQEKPVEVIFPVASLDYWDPENGPSQWEFDRYRLSVLSLKQRLMDAAMDGVLPPEVEDVTEARAGRRLTQWLERIESTGALVRNIRPIVVPLVFTTAEEEVTARRRYGDFSSCNGRWNGVASGTLHQRLQSNPEEWQLYHTDLEQIRRGWAVDPLQEAINFCSKSSGLVIGDFGCGTAQLAEALRGRHTVHSFDHVALTGSDVIECDIAAGVPLEDGCLDYAVFSLSLMGTNWRDQLTEAWRTLKPTGQLLIWTASKGKDEGQYVEHVERAGFAAIKSELHNKWLHVWATKVLAAAVINRQEAA